MTRSETPLPESRGQWIRDICEGLGGLFQRSGALGIGRLSDELGDPNLLRALLIMRIAVLQGRGRPALESLTPLMGSPVFTSPEPSTDELSELVTNVHRRMEQDGVTGWVLLLGLGLRIESPESTYRLLLCAWAGQRAAMVSESQVGRELKRYWALENLETDDLVVPHSLAPPPVYLEIHSRLRVHIESDHQAANLVALSLIKTGGTFHDRWLNGFPAYKADHLRLLGSDKAQCDGSLAYLRTVIERLDSAHELRPIAIRAVALVEEQLAHVSAAIESLSPPERDLLRPRSAEQSFRDGCVLTFLNWPLDRTAHTQYPGLQTVHGTWGPVPWWSLTARHSDEVEATIASRDEGVLPLSVEMDPAEPNLLTLVCRKPRTETPGLLAQFAFDLSHPVHVCELLLLSRRDGVPIDLYVESGDEWDHDADYVGTLRAPIGPELAQFITDIATEALAQMVPTSRSQGYDIHDGIPVLTEALQRTGSRRLVGGYSAPHRIAVASYQGKAGALRSLNADPPVSMAGFARHERKAPPGQGDQAVGTLGKDPREVGFVYVQRNPAFPEMLKIGYTEQLAEDRARALSGTSVPYPFEVLFRVSTARASKVERAVHRLLAAHRVSANREFFRVSLDVAKNVIHHCQQAVTGIHTWESLPTVHRLRAGDRVALPLQAGQVFALTARPDLFSNSADVLDLWQAHSDDDLLEIHATHKPGHVAGLSDNDPGGETDPVPFLNRDGTACNRLLMGRERLVAGDRLVWLSDREGPDDCRSVVFEADGFCQVTYRTSSPQFHPSGMPLLLNALEVDPTPAMGEHMRAALALPAPRTWAPRSPQPDEEWAGYATDPQPPEYWLPQLEQRKRRAP
ncbi:GIY-YIG nuclease family protein [Streptomyces anulatus]|uniref:GIY-YIG nuclease family protein n=1 Tax=Streptomyces anulatus TaxID=1892 RepID=UPI001C5D1B38|nr:GIY-YIG nuclease family protein [Streptomyces anulatus]QYA96843.1 GIY-YIG nuclease family protein [Streptomyces anulatus]